MLSLAIITKMESTNDKIRSCYTQLFQDVGSKTRSRPATDFLTMTLQESKVGGGHLYKAVLKQGNANKEPISRRAENKFPDAEPTKAEPALVGTAICTTSLNREPFRV